MRSLLLVSLLVSTISVVLIAGIRQVGARQPQSLIVRAMYLDDCVLPCWIGIKPGTATVREAVDHLRGLFNLPPETAMIDSRVMGDTSGYTVTSYGDNTTVIFTGNGREDTVDEYIYLISDESLLLGDILLAYGIPSCFSRRDVNTWNLVYYSNEQTILFLQTGQILRYTNPIQAVMYAPQQRSILNRSCQNVPGGHDSWRGIAPAWRYAQFAY